MNTRSLTNGVRLTVSMFRCSRLSARGLTTLRNTVQSGATYEHGATLNICGPKLISQIVRPMSSTVKFEVINVQDEEDFKKRVLATSSSTPVVVDFHATWCGPCKVLGPRLESLLSQGDGKVLMAKVDIDENPELAMEYGVRSVPTVVGVKDGKVLNQFIGVIDDDQINSFVDKLVIS